MPQRASSVPEHAIVRAVQISSFGCPEVLEIVRLTDPHAGAGEVRVRVRAAGLSTSDWVKRRGGMDQHLPQTFGYEACGVVDEVGPGAAGVRRGDRVVGLSPDGAAQAELAVLSSWAPVPHGLDDVQAAALPASSETAARGLDQLGVVASGRSDRPPLTVLVHGASGSVGTAAVQLALARGARVIGTGSPATHAALRALGAEPVAYGAGMVDRVHALAPQGVDRALDVAGSGVLPELVALTGSPRAVVTLADAQGARSTGVRFSCGEDGRAGYVLEQVVGLAAAGRFTVPVGRTFALDEVAEAHRVGEARTVRGKLVLVV